MSLKQHLYNTLKALLQHFHSTYIALLKHVSHHFHTTCRALLLLQDFYSASVAFLSHFHGRTIRHLPLHRFSDQWLTSLDGLYGSHTSDLARAPPRGSVPSPFASSSRSPRPAAAAGQLSERGIRGRGRPASRRRRAAAVGGRRRRQVYARDATTISPYALLLFGGALRVEHAARRIVVDEWLAIDASPRTAVLVKQAHPPDPPARPVAGGRAGVLECTRPVQTGREVCGCVSCLPRRMDG